MVDVVLGMMVGSLMGEYVFQSERVLATRRSDQAESAQAGLIHAAVWAGSVFMGGLLVTGEMTRDLVQMTAVAAALHGATDCTRLRQVLIGATGVPSVDKFLRTRQLEGDDEFASHLWSAELTYAVVGEKVFDAAMHALCVFVAWRVGLVI